MPIANPGPSSHDAAQITMFGSSASSAIGQGDAAVDARAERLVQAGDRRVVERDEHGDEHRGDGEQRERGAGADAHGGTAPRHEPRGQHGECDRRTTPVAASVGGRFAQHLADRTEHDAEGHDDRRDQRACHGSSARGHVGAGDDREPGAASAKTATAARPNR